MAKLLAQAAAGAAFLLAAIGAALFVAAGTLDYARAWAFLAVFASCVAAITIDLARRDPALLARRVKAGPIAEPTRGQQIIQALASLAFLAIFVAAGLDRRCDWSSVPTAVAVLGDVLVAAGLGVVALVFRANTFTSAVVEVDREQRLVSTGPYAVIRHPMYGGALVMLVGVPLALGSWWAVVPVAALAGVIVIRLRAEEAVLAAELAGYVDYTARVRHRLIPFVW
jgi:protein-S-isoprenylcysteine O-methyltransferase Ste14